MKPLYIIAGEASGDLLGSHIMRAFPHRYVGVGGNKMSLSCATFDKFFDSSELSLMGIMEVLPHIPRLMKLIKNTVDHIIESQPQALITIDAPDFTQRVIKKLRQHPGYQANPFPCVHVGAPTVWAWRSGRAKKIAQICDQLWTLFPFEPPYFPDLPTHFVGHPVGDAIDDIIPARDFHTCLLLPGSRVGEIKRHWPILRDVCEKNPDISYVLLTLPHLVPVIQNIAPLPPHCSVVTEYNMGRAHVALAASGTVSLELAKVGTPMVTFYRMNPITAWVAKKLVKIPYVNLVNILIDNYIVPEFLQEDMTEKNITKALRSLHGNFQSWQLQQNNLKKAIEMLKGPEGSFAKSIKMRIEKLLSK